MMIDAKGCLLVAGLLILAAAVVYFAGLGAFVAFRD
jgi:hypothetical protein